jgi:hypothetical protein
VLAHGVAGVIGRVTLDPGKAACLAKHRIDHLGIEPTVALNVGISKLIGCGSFATI